MPTDALIVDAVRSPIGRKGGTLSHIRGDELSAQVVNGLIARKAEMAAGWPVEVSVTTVDRQCGSSMQTNFNAATDVMAGQLDVVVSAGVEMMSRVPMGSNGGDVSSQVTDRFDIVPQGISAELIAQEWSLTREELDAYSLESHRRAAAAIDEAKFANEVIPYGDVSVDEAVRRETSLEALGALRTAFLPDGVITAGNASQIVDGSAAVLIASESACSRLGLQPRGRFVSFGIAGVDPTRMLHGNPPAMRKALDKAGITLDDVSVIEVNEAFASVVLQTAKDLHLEDRMDDVNPNGGGISLGHPLGATGARITATLLNELDRRDARYGIASMCVGFGMAIAGVVERLGV
jgi:acetyl-CoA acyltransferase